MLKSPTLQFHMLSIASYSDDEDEDQSMTCGTMSSVSTDFEMDSFLTVAAQDLLPVRSTSSLTMTFFQHALENELETNRSKNTYFMDGGNRFISVPNLGYHSRPCASIARLFEDWLAEKLYCQPTAIIAEQRLPILQDSVELVAEDILNKIKSNLVWRKSIDKVLIKVRAGHVYTYHSLEDGQPLITQEMEELFQQFPLFVEMQVYATLKAGCSSTQCMLVVENVTVNPQQPYKIMEEF